MRSPVRDARLQLNDEANKLSACMCAAVDVIAETAKYAAQKSIAIPPFGTEDIRSLAVTLYIRRRDEGKRSA